MRKGLSCPAILLAFGILGVGIRAEAADELSSGLLDTDTVVEKSSEEEQRGIPSDTGFSTCEESIRYFAACLADGDLDGAVAAFAIEHLVDTVDYGAYLERMGAWTVRIQIPLNPEDGLARQLDLATVRNNITDHIFNFCMGLGIDFAWEEVQEIEDGDAFAENLTLEDFPTFQVLRMDYVEPEQQDSENYRKLVERQCEIYGCTGIEDYYVLYELAGKTYVGSVQFMEYEDQWYLYDLNSPLGGLGVSAVWEISREDYEASIRGEKK